MKPLARNSKLINATTGIHANPSMSGFNQRHLSHPGEPLKNPENEEPNPEPDQTRRSI
ncbi:hypothetical protein YC2023_037345 [Brassica napus]